MCFEELKEVFVDTLSCDADKVTPEASLTEDLQADSLDAVELNMAFEDKFGVSIADEDLVNLKTAGAQLSAEGPPRCRYSSPQLDTAPVCGL